VWTAIPSAQKGAADISGATTAASVAAIFETAFDALVSVPFATDDSAADGTMLTVMNERGVADEAETFNEDDSGSGSISETLTTAGVDTEVNITDDEFTIPSHGLTTGLKGRLTTTGTLPAGVTTGVDYFVIMIDEDTIQLAASLSDALDGVPIDITTLGSNGAVNTFTATSVSANVKLRQSNDGINWTDLTNATNITVDAVIYLEKVDPTAQYAQVYFTITAGRISADSLILVKGLN